MVPSGKEDNVGEESVGDILLLRALTATEIGLVGQLKFPC
jgi:hypothetical protein